MNSENKEVGVVKTKPCQKTHLARSKRQCFNANISLEKCSINCLQSSSAMTYQDSSDRVCACTTVFDPVARANPTNHGKHIEQNEFEMPKFVDLWRQLRGPWPALIMSDFRNGCPASGRIAPLDTDRRACGSFRLWPTRSLVGDSSGSCKRRMNLLSN